MRNPFRSESGSFRLVIVVIAAALAVVVAAAIDLWLGVAAAVLAIAGFLWWLVQEPVPGAGEPAPPLESSTLSGSSV
jgi:hypothetical protein